MSESSPSTGTPGHPSRTARQEPPAALPAAKTVSWAGLFHLSIVYLVWGSTYLAIRVAVREGSGFPPFTLVGMRVLLAGVLLLGWAGLSGRRLTPTRRELVILAASGLLLWVGGNGLVTWAEQRAHSSYAALLVGAAPIWAVLIESALDRKAPSLLLVGSLLVGLAGIAVLSVPVLASGVRADLLSMLALLLAGLSWASGSLLQTRHPVSLGPRVSSGYQQLIAGLGFVVLILALREPRPSPVPEAWLAWGYLVVFGSLFAFTAYVQALRLLPIHIAMTYAYVNPVIAVVLGWVILREPITGWTVGGTALVLLGVGGVFRMRFLRRPAVYHTVKREETQGSPEVETSGQ